MPGSNFGRDTDFPDRVSHEIPRSFKMDAAIVLPSRFIPFPFQFHRSEIIPPFNVKQIELGKISLITQ
jgi:hypothetical protein